MKYSVKEVYIERDKNFNLYFGKRLISILCGNVSFEDACQKIYQSIIEGGQK